MKIYTKTGDDGTTGLLGGSRVKKYDIRLEAYGTVDELNASVGVIRSNALPEKTDSWLLEIQNKLFNIGSVLASDERGKKITKKLEITADDIFFLEKAIDEMESELPKLKQFILPGGDMASALCHVARTVCRRAERRIIEFNDMQEVQSEMIKYINRLSDFLFVLSRKLADNRGVGDIHWAH